MGTASNCVCDRLLPEPSLQRNLPPLPSPLSSCSTLPFLPTLKLHTIEHKVTQYQLIHLLG